MCQQTRRRTLVHLCAGGVLALSGLGRATPGHAKPITLPKPGPRDVCPVCGMFVAPYPYWIATVVYKDGKAVHFDGAKDFFKYLLALKKYEPSRASHDIQAMGVTAYYEPVRIEARAAWYVVGSDVLGPMGHELVPHDTEADAKEFVADHKGLRIVRYNEVTMSMLEGLDAGRFA